jgi:L-ascorbate metabolism protein UlaG (beta-lactamase superfamily)
MVVNSPSFHYVRLRTFLEAQRGTISAMQITWFGHSCIRIDLGKSSILIDPFLTGTPTVEDSGGTVRSASKGVTHVALTHGHEDHTGDAVAICKDNATPLIAVYELALHMASLGVEKIDPGNTGGTIHHEDFDISFVPAWHSSGVFHEGRSIYLGACCGLVIAPRDGKTVYHMGDTAIFSDMGLINEIYRPQVGIVPIGDRFTMGAKTAALACKRYFQFETIVPVHYGTFPGWLDLTADKFVAEMGGNTVKVPKVGVPFEI